MTISFETIRHLFDGDGCEMMWSMSRVFEKAFDKHTFCLLPIVTPNKPDEWKLVLMD
jgi:hypothetical protein